MMETLSSTKTQSWLVWFLRGVLILGFLVLAGRLLELQVIRGSYFRQLSEENRIRRVPIVAPRGEIKARGGEVLVGNIEVKKKVVFDNSAGFRKLSDIEGTLASEVITEWERQYKEGSNFAHLSGYLGEVSEEELGKVQAECPEKGPRKLGDLTGRSGLEEQYDCTLRGIDGEELVEVDAMGVKIRTIGRKNPVKGQDIITTIDAALQSFVARQLRSKKGAIIVTDKNGEVLALLSSPSYNPNIFVNKDENENIQKVLEDRGLPLFNRVIGGLYHPGSVFKPVVAIAALEEGKIDEKFKYEDTGHITINTSFGTFSYKNWYFTQYGGREGVIGLTRAITRSTDTFFYKIGELTGVENLKKWAHIFGLDEKTQVDIPGEIAGLVPDPEWKLQVKGERWFLGNTYHMSIGQGDIAVTPIGINTVVSAIASGGKLCIPHIINTEESRNFQFPTTESRNLSNFQCRDLGIKKQNLDLVKEGMVGVCSLGGTGYTFFDFSEKSGKKVACKTGTAETENGEPHAWFVAFAPTDEPEIVATVLVENGGEGSKVAGPIAREIFNYWFEIQSSITPTITPIPAND